MKSEIKFRMVAYTDAAGKYTQGAPANGNEDNFYVDDNLADEFPGNCVADKIGTLSDCGCLMVVADGMGGMNAGEVASKIAVDTVGEFFAPGIISPQMAANARERKKYMEEVITEADNRIKKDSKQNAEHRGMGSTIIMAWIVGDEMTISWCGDSRAYRYNDANGIELLSKDHSYVQELVDKGIITYEDTFEHPQGNIVTNSLGDVAVKARPESRQFKVYDGDIVLLCSDGLSGVLRDKKVYGTDGCQLPGDTLEDIISENHNSLKECREALWKAAEQADWYDNVTAVLCEIISGAGTCPPKAVQPPVSEIVNKTNHIRMTKGTLSAVVVAVLFLLAATVGATWYFASKKKDTDAKPVKVSDNPSKQEEISTQEFDHSLSPEVYTRQSELLSRIKTINKQLESLLSDKTKKLEQKINEATDTTALTGIEKEITLIEQKIPIIKEVSAQIEKAKGDKKKKLKELRKKILQAEKVTLDSWKKEMDVFCTDEKPVQKEKVKTHEEENTLLLPNDLTPAATPPSNKVEEPVSPVKELKVPSTTPDEKVIVGTIQNNDTNYKKFKEWIEKDNKGYKVTSIFYTEDNGETMKIVDNKSLIHAIGKKVTIKLKQK